MSGFVKFVILVGAVAVAAGIGFMMIRPGAKPQEPSPPSSVSQSASPLVGETNPSGFFTRHRPLIQSNEPVVGVAATATNSMAEWSDKVDGILTSDHAEADKARELLEIFPRLPEAGQVEVANHLSNLTPNEGYASLARLLSNAELPPEVLDVLFRDALTRPNSLKLSALLEVARNPQHPKATDAKEMLAFLLEEDDGDDWTKWQAGVDAWLKANPD